MKILSAVSRVKKNQKKGCHFLFITFVCLCIGFCTGEMDKAPSNPAAVNTTVASRPSSNGPVKPTEIVKNNDLINSRRSAKRSHWSDKGKCFSFEDVHLNVDGTKIDCIGDVPNVGFNKMCN